MNRRVFLPLLAVLIPLAAGHAQQRATVSQRVEPSLYEFKNLDGDSAKAVCHVASQLYGVFIEFSPDIRMALISPNAPAATDWRDRTIEFLKKYDAAKGSSPQVHYLAYLIRAAKGNSDSEKEVSSVPKELNDAIEEMKRSLTYAKYDVLAEVASVSEGGASASDRLPGGQFVHRYVLEYGHVTVTPDHKSVSIHPFQFRLEASGATGFYTAASISSDITVRAGQKLVLGKVRLSDAADLFVILTAKVE